MLTPFGLFYFVYPQRDIIKNVYVHLDVNKVLKLFLIVLNKFYHEVLQTMLVGIYASLYGKQDRGFV